MVVIPEQVVIPEAKARARAHSRAQKEAVIPECFYWESMSFRPLHALDSRREHSGMTKVCFKSKLELKLN